MEWGQVISIPIIMVTTITNKLFLSIIFICEMMLLDMIFHLFYLFISFKCVATFCYWMHLIDREYILICIYHASFL